MHYLFWPFFLLAAILGHSEANREVLPSKTKEFTLCICAMFNSEAPYLKEWIEYHLLLGTQHFFLYNNESTDDYLTVLEPYLEQNIVELREWPSQEDELNWMDAQRRAYNHCITLCSHQTEWLAFIDIDEFIVPVDKPDLIAYLAPFNDQPTIGGIQINWQLYGTSWLPEIPKGKLLIESLILKAPWDYVAPKAYNGRVKSIVRPYAVDFFDIHTGIYKAGFTIFPEQKKGRKDTQPIQVDHIRVNHYWTRAEDFFYKAKIPRQLTPGLSRSGDMVIILKKLEDLNQVEDRIMMRFVPELRKKIFPVEN